MKEQSKFDKIAQQIADQLIALHGEYLARKVAKLILGTDQAGAAGAANRERKC